MKVEHVELFLGEEVLNVVAEGLRILLLLPVLHGLDEVAHGRLRCHQSSCPHLATTTYATVSVAVKVGSGS